MSSGRAQEGSPAAPASATGRLAIWNDCARDREAAYEIWYQTEHLEERLSVPGFRRGRRYEATDRDGGFFTYYETDSPHVLTSEAYIHRVNNPTPMTAAIMRDAFLGVSRTICEVSVSTGKLRGTFAATLQLNALPSPDRLARWAGADSRTARIARIEGWRAVEDSLPPSTEARLRGGDDRIDACLLIETLRERDCATLTAELAEELGVPAEKAASFRLLCELSND